MLALLDTGFSNLKAFVNVLNYIGKKYVIIDNGNDLIVGHHNCLLLPGVSNFGALATELDKRNFRSKIIDSSFSGSKIVGTCSGMQVLFNCSEESTSAKGLGLINGKVKKFPQKDKIDINIGWKKTKSSKYFFIHGFYCSTNESLEQEEYSNFNGIRFLSEFQHRNIFGFQYHPEKSGIEGVDRLESIISKD
jgi:imidazole glycerol phosphate synthase glutamine amidotransferase subunit